MLYMRAQKFTEFVSVRLDPPTYALVHKVAEAQGVVVSDFIRRAVKRELARLSFLPSEEKRALEVVEIEK